MSDIIFPLAFTYYYLSHSSLSHSSSLYRITLSLTPTLHYLFCETSCTSYSRQRMKVKTPARLSTSSRGDIGLGVAVDLRSSEANGEFCEPTEVSAESDESTEVIGEHDKFDGRRKRLI